MEMAAAAPVHANDYKYNITLNSSPNSLKSIFLWFFSTSDFRQVQIDKGCTFNTGGIEVKKNVMLKQTR